MGSDDAFCNAPTRAPMVKAPGSYRATDHNDDDDDEMEEEEDYDGVLCLMMMVLVKMLVMMSKQVGQTLG